MLPNGPNAAAGNANIALTLSECCAMHIAGEHHHSQRAAGARPGHQRCAAALRQRWQQRRSERRAADGARRGGLRPQRLCRCSLRRGDGAAPPCGSVALRRTRYIWRQQRAPAGAAAAAGGPGAAAGHPRGGDVCRQRHAAAGGGRDHEPAGLVGGAGAAHKQLCGPRNSIPILPTDTNMGKD